LSLQPIISPGSVCSSKGPPPPVAPPTVLALERGAQEVRGGELVDAPHAPVARVCPTNTNTDWTKTK
jgi:hypothetical protein